MRKSLIDERINKEQPIHQWYEYSFVAPPREPYPTRRRTYFVLSLGMYRVKNCRFFQYLVPVASVVQTAKCETFDTEVVISNPDIPGVFSRRIAGRRFPPRVHSIVLEHHSIVLESKSARARDGRTLLAVKSRSLGKRPQEEGEAKKKRSCRTWPRVTMVGAPR